MDTSHFDVVVCGSDLAGVIAAALLGRRGARVLLCGHDRPPPTFEAAGYLLAREPDLLPPVDSEPVARVFRELNQTQVVRRRAPGRMPAVQLVTPRQRIDLGPDATTCARELAREYPADHEAGAQALARLREASAALEPLLASDLTLPPDGFWERREVARVEGQVPAPDTDLLAPLGPAHPLRAALVALAGLTVGYAPGEITAAALARAVEHARRGAHLLEGAPGAVRALFTEKMATFSGEVRERLVPVELAWKRGRAAGLRVRPRGETIGLDALVWAGPAAALATLCGERTGRKLRDAAASLRPSCYRYALCLLVRPDAIPEGMGPRVVMVRDPEQPPLDDNALVVTVGVPDPRHPDLVPVWAECLVPAAAAALGPGYLGVLRARVRERMSYLLPFFERHLVVLASPHDGLAPELPEGAQPPAPPHPVPPAPLVATVSYELSRMLGVGGAQHATGIKNVFLASSENLPGLGREGDFISAWGVTRLIAGAQPRQDLARREILIEDV